MQPRLWHNSYPPGMPVELPIETHLTVTDEIEAVVTMLDDVLECACIGVPDERSGEAPHLYVVAARADLTRADVEQHCRANLTGYKVPRHITFVTSLPKSTVGKILRRELRESSARTATTA